MGDEFGFFRQCGTVFYLVLYGAVRCGAYMCIKVSHPFYRSIYDVRRRRPFECPLPLKQGNLILCSAKQTDEFFTLLASKERTYFGIL